MPTVTRHPLWALLLERRCLFLFLALLALLIAMAFLGDTVHGRVILAFVNATVLLTAVAAVGRSQFSLVIGVLLVVPALAFRVLSLESSTPGYFASALGFSAIFFAFIIGELLHYVLRRDLMTEDKLYGAVAAYMLIAVLWASLYGLVQYFYPGAYALGGTPKALDMAELIYFSFTASRPWGLATLPPC